MKNILVPTDFSPNAEKALNYAVQIAKQIKAEIFLIHAVELPDTPFNTPHSDSYQKISANINDQLHMISSSIHDTELIKVTTKLYTNLFIDSILEALTDFNIDFIVMGTIGSSGIQEKLFGSKTALTIGKSQVPVLAIPLLSKWEQPKKIMIALNELTFQNEILDPVFILADTFISTVQVAIFTDTDDDAVEQYKINQKKILEIRDKLINSNKNIDIQAVHLGGKHFYESLNKWVEEEKINMLVMLTHKRNLLESIFVRSKTKKMSYQTNIPLLAIPF